MLLALSLLPLAGRAFADTNADVRTGPSGHRAFVTRVGAAEAAGYGLFRDAAGLACIAQPGLGGMGVHYVNPALVVDTVLDPARPEALVYEPRQLRPHEARGARVHRVQGRVGRDAHGAADAVRNAVRLHAGPNRYGIPAFYALHAWIWKEIRAGMFKRLEPARDLRLRGGARDVSGDSPWARPFSARRGRSRAPAA